MSAWTCRHTDGKAAQKIVPPRLRIPYWKGLGADSEEKHEPVGDTNTAKMNSLKVLDPKRPIREADIGFLPVQWITSLVRHRPTTFCRGGSQRHSRHRRH